MYSDPEQREQEIKNLSVAFKSIAEEILPQLRRSRLKLTVDVTGRSDAEITKLAIEDASKLNVEELLYAATLTEDKTNYPSEIRGFNNLGVVQYQQGNDQASANFAKALSIDPKSPDANYNAGLCALQKGNLAKAEESFGKAAGTKANLGNAMGTVYLLNLHSEQQQPTTVL